MKNRKVFLLTVLGVCLCLLMIISGVTGGSSQEEQGGTDNKALNGPSDSNSLSSGSEVIADWLNDNDEKSIVGKNKTEYNLTRQFLVAVVLVALLGGAAWLILRKFPAKVTAGKSDKIAVSDSVNLGSGRALHLVEVEGGKKILIGVTNENINKLAEFESEVGL